MSQYFSYNQRLGIDIPSLDKDWDGYSEHTKETILLNWERIRGKIPDRIAELEAIINKKQDELSEENNFQLSCKLNSEIAELASVINDLWLWFRTHQDISGKMHQ